MTEQLLHKFPSAILIIDPQDRISFANAPYFRLFGLPTDTPVVGLATQEWYHRILPLFVAPDALSMAGFAITGTRQDVLNQRFELRCGRVVARDVVVLDDGGWLITYRDVTAEDRARRELAKVAHLSAHNPNPIFRTTLSGRVVYRNAAAERLLRSFSKADLLAIRQFSKDVLAANSADEIAQRYDFTLLERAFEVYVTPFRKDDHASIHVIETTARHAAVAENQRQKVFYEAILSHLPADVVVIDPDLRYRYVNPQAVTDPDVRRWMIGRDDLEYFARRKRPMMVAQHRQALLRQALATKQQVSWSEEATYPANGGKKYLTRFARPVFDEAGQPLMIIGYGMDITPIRVAQLTLERSEKQYRNLMHYSQALICTHDLSGRVLTVNPAVAHLLGCEMHELIDEYLVNMLPAEVSYGVAKYLKHIKAHHEAKGVMKMQPLHEAPPRYLLYHNILVEEAAEGPYIIGYAQDITARVLAERALKKAKIAAENAALARQNFLASMSHEIRTPLNGVLGMAGLLEKTALTVQQQQYVSLIRTAGRSLLELLNDVLDMAKISSGEVELAQMPFDLCAVVRETAEPLLLRAAEKGIDFTIHPLSEEEIGVIGDPKRLRQILTNLLSNAVKFTERGGVTLQGKLSGMTDTTLTVTFLVHDSGIGIPLEQQEKVFDEFKQATPDTALRFGGTGLGLAISERLVGQLGGRLILSSEPEVGTTFGFTLTFPRTTPEAPLVPNVATTVPSADHSEIWLAGLRVLLVEDHSINRLLARMILLSYGALVTEAHTGTEAVEKATTQPFDVILMDIQLPEMNGLEATAAIRALPDRQRATTPILALTANAFPSDTERYMAAGMNGCLTKPFEEAELLRLLQLMVTRFDTHSPETVGYQNEASETPTLSQFPTTLMRICTDDQAFAARLIEEFSATTPALLTRLALTTPADHAEVAAIAHRLIPAARVLDAHEALYGLKELEKISATNPQWADIRDYTIGELQTLLQELHQWQVAYQASANPSVVEGV